MYPSLELLNPNRHLQCLKLLQYQNIKALADMFRSFDGVETTSMWPTKRPRQYPPQTNPFVR